MIRLVLKYPVENKNTVNSLQDGHPRSSKNCRSYRGVLLTGSFNTENLAKNVQLGPTKVSVLWRCPLRES